MLTKLKIDLSGWSTKDFSVINDNTIGLFCDNIATMPKLNWLGLLFGRTNVHGHITDTTMVRYASLISGFKERLVAIKLDMSGWTSSPSITQEGAI